MVQWNVESDHLIVQVTSLPSFATPVCSPLLKPPSQAPGPGGGRKAEGVDQSPSAQPKRRTDPGPSPARKRPGPGPTYRPTHLPPCLSDLSDLPDYLSITQTHAQLHKDVFRRSCFNENLRGSSRGWHYSPSRRSKNSEKRNNRQQVHSGDIAQCDNIVVPAVVKPAASLPGPLSRGTWPISACSSSLHGLGNSGQFFDASSLV